LKQGKLTLSVGRNCREPGPRLHWDQWRRRSAVPGVQAWRRHPQSFAYPAKDIFAFPRVHRVLQ
jgi:hypothetical protein